MNRIPAPKPLAAATRPARRGLAIAAALLAATTATACTTTSSSTAPAGPASTGAPANAGSAPANAGSAPALAAYPPVNVAIGVSSLTIANWPAFIADQMGYFKKFNINPTIQLTPGGLVVSALVAGSIQFGPAFGDALLADAKGQDIHFLMNLYVGSTAECVLGPNSAKKTGVAPGAPVRQRVLALKGLKIATVSVGSNTTLEPRAAFAAAGGHGQLTFITIAQTAMDAALKSGAIDGFCADPSTATPAVQSGDAVVWLNGPGGDFRQAGLNDNLLPVAPLFALGKTIQAPHELAARVVAAYIMAADLVRTDPAAALAAVKRSPALATLPAASIDAVWAADKQNLTHPEFTSQSLQEGLAVQRQNPALDFSKLDTTALIDPQVYLRALQLARAAENG